MSAAPAAAAGPCPRAERGQDEVPEIPDGAADGHRRHPLQPRQPPAAQKEAVVRARRARVGAGAGGEAAGGRARRAPRAGGAAAISEPGGPSAAASRAHAGRFGRDPRLCPGIRRAARCREGGAGTRRLTGTGAPVSRPGLVLPAPSPRVVAQNFQPGFLGGREQFISSAFSVISQSPSAVGT